MTVCQDGRTVLYKSGMAEKFVRGVQGMHEIVVGCVVGVRDGFKMMVLRLVSASTPDGIPITGMNHPN